MKPHTFDRHQRRFAKQHNIPFEQMDPLFDKSLLDQFPVSCSETEVTGNSARIVGALHGYKKDQLLDNDFYSKHKQWFVYEGQRWQPTEKTTN